MSQSCSARYLLFGTLFFYYGIRTRAGILSDKAMGANYFGAALTAAAIGVQTAPLGLILFLQAPDMGEQFFLVGHAGEVPAEHLIGPQRRFAARP